MGISKVSADAVDTVADKATAAKASRLNFALNNDQVLAATESVRVWFAPINASTMSTPAWNKAVRHSTSNLRANENSRIEIMDLSHLLVRLPVDL